MFLKSGDFTLKSGFVLLKTQNSRQPWACTPQGGVGRPCHLQKGQAPRLAGVPSLLATTPAQALHH